MVKHSLLLVLAILVACVGAACKKKSTGPSAEEAQKRFQAAQRLRAIKTYEEIAKKYPESPYAAKSQTRARVLKTEAGIPEQAPAKK